MNKVIKLSVLALGLTMGLQVPFAFADDCNKPEYQSLLKIKNPDVLQRINELDLTQAQKHQFKVMKSNFDAENKKLGVSIKEINMQMNEIVASPTIDQSRLDSLILDVQKIIVSGQSQAATFRHNLYNLLNEKQKTKYHELQQQERQFFRMSLQCPDMVAKKLKDSHHFDPFDHINELNLTQEQKTKIMALINSNRDQAKKVMTQFDDSAMSVNQMEDQIVQSTSPIDSAKLDAFTTAVAVPGGELQKNRVMTYHEIYKTLNAKQQAQFMKILNKPQPKS